MIPVLDYRARPIEAASALVVERIGHAAARSGQEDGIAIRPGYQLTDHAVTGRPCPGALFNQLPLLLTSRHSP